MTKKKKLLIVLGVIAAIAVIAVLLGNLTGKSEKGMYASPAAETAIARESSYQSYLDSCGFADVLSQAEIPVDVFTFEKSEDSNAMPLTEGVDTGDTGSITWRFTAPETGFYNLEIGYMALAGTTSDIQRRVLIDGEAPYEALTQIVFKRIWRDEDIRLKNENEIRPNAD